ncbi:MAG: MinD/ParA family protein [Sphingomonadales bacterium]
MTSTAAVSALNPHIALERRLITIASGKGGVGKTWLAITLAHALARQGRKVLLFDGDLGLANVDIQLGLMPNRDLGDVIAGRCGLTEAVTRYDDEAPRPAGFDVVAGKSGSGALGSLARERLGALRHHLIEAAIAYDHVILDLAAGIDSAVTTLAHHGGATLVVLTAEPTSLTDAYAFIKLRRMRDAAADIRIIVNQAADKSEGEATYETIRKACASFLKFTPALGGIIYRDGKVSDAIRHQSSILSRHPQASAAGQVEALAKSLVAEAKRQT